MVLQGFRAGVPEAAPWRGPGRDFLCGPLHKAQDPSTTRPWPHPGLPRKQRLWLPQRVLLANAKERLGGMPGLRLWPGFRAQAWALLRDLLGILQEPLFDSLWLERVRPGREPRLSPAMRR